MNTVLIFSDCTGRREYVNTERYPPTLEYWRIIAGKTVLPRLQLTRPSAANKQKYYTMWVRFTNIIKCGTQRRAKQHHIIACQPDHIGTG